MPYSRLSRQFFARSLFAGIFAFVLTTQTLFAATGTRAMVATADSLATDAALKVLRRGGNAVDAAIAAQWVLNVVEPYSSGIGGGGFFMVYNAADRKVYTFDGREKAPRAVHPNLFIDKTGQPMPFWPDRVSGGLPVGVPGLLKMLEHVHKNFGSGTFTFGQLFEPAATIAEKGYYVSPRHAAFIESEKQRLALFTASSQIFFNAQGTPKLPGEVIFMPDLARTFRLIAEKGSDVFYSGEIARDIVLAVQQAPYHPGYMVLEDMKNYQIVERAPISTTYRGHTIFGMGPPSSGGTTVLQTLNTLENFDFGSYSRVEQLSLLGQAQWLAFRDRNELLGDPDFVEVPVERLISKEYAGGFASALEIDRPEAIMGVKGAREPEHTSHISIVDEKGNIVSFTTTIEHLFGSALTVPGRGIILNNELTDFEPIPQMANSPMGGKRPRSSMSPTIVFKEGKPILVAGSPGGSKIIGIIINILVNVLDRKMPLEAAMAEPRILNREGPLEVEKEIMDHPDAVNTLKQWGFEITPAGPMGNAQAIQITDSGLIGASDPRGDGLAKGY